MSRYISTRKAREITGTLTAVLSLSLLLSALIAVGLLSLVSCSSDYRDDPVETGFFPAPGDSAIAVLPDGSSYKITFDGVTGRTWCYTIEWLSGKDLSHWVLGLECHLVQDPGGHVVDAGGGVIVNPDPTTGVVGVKWEPAPNGSGTYCITMDDDYLEQPTIAAFKAGDLTNFAIVSIPGPSCETIIIHDQGSIGP